MYTGAGEGAKDHEEHDCDMQITPRIQDEREKRQASDQQHRKEEGRASGARDGETEREANRDRSTSDNRRNCSNRNLPFT